MTPRRSFVLALATATITFGVAACGESATSNSASPGRSPDRPDVVVTNPILGAVVMDIAGDAAEVTVLMPNGTDPHDWSPSAKEISTLLAADLIVENGLALETNLQNPIKEAKVKGIGVFTVADHVTVRKIGEGEIAEDHDGEETHSPGEEEREHTVGADDPHLWMDPLTMKQWVGPLATELKGVNVDAAAGATKVEAELDALHAELAKTLESVPADQRKLVTGHESLGYLAARYDYELVGAVIPEITSQAEASAGELAELTRKIKSAGVKAIFTELGTPAATVQAVSRDTGAKVVELSTHSLPSDGTYRTFMLDISNQIAGALR